MVEVDDVQRARVEVAAGHHRQQAAVRADHHAQRAVVHLDVGPGRGQRLTGRHQDAAVRLHADGDAMFEGQAGCRDPHRQDQRRYPPQKTRSHSHGWEGWARAVTLAPTF